MGLFSHICSIFKKSKSDYNPKYVGCNKDALDTRDHIKVCSPVYSDSLKSILGFSLKKYAPKVRNQKDTSACGGFSAAAAVYILRNKMLKMMYGENEETPKVTFSPLYIYYNARFEDSIYEDDEYGKLNFPLYDTGTNIRDVMKALKKYGVIAENVMPFNSYTVKENPPIKNIDISKNFKIKEYLRIKPDNTAEETCKNVLAVEHLPIIIGLNLFKENIYDLEKTGYLNPVDKNKSEKTGGHAVCVTGFKTINGKTWFEFINSWGESSGDHGYGYFPAEFLSDKFYTLDIWTFDKSYF